ncbi:2-dehydro-3-deoxygluconokinase [Paenibacillus nasutitermitis]|uniref:2-dehydro-3-deoxygluconokinase n=1 Tax=Paenibacillus nasutitermitis TaxID=1652958 RepID=A0A917DXG9_9BACL|nr:2-dehydro-3-deoxygluconokinase [Paenibacillus nasutitermitis]
MLFQPMTEGPIAYAPLYGQSVAGSETNVAIGLTRLGKQARWIGRLGEDPFGDLVLRTLAGEGLDVGLAVRDSSAPTGLFFKEFKGYGDPNVYFYRARSAASRLTAADVREEWFAGAKHLHVTGITPALGDGTADAIRIAMNMAREQGLTVSFDPNLRRKLWDEKTARDTLLSLVPLCDLFLPGAEEAEFLLGEMSPDAYGHDFLQMGPSVVALKLGEDGSVGFTGDAILRVPGYRVERVVDTVGAGDAFAAGLLSVMVGPTEDWRTERLPELLLRGLERANVYGALATQFKGDWSGLPSLSELEALMQGKRQTTR